MIVEGNIFCENSTFMKRILSIFFIVTLTWLIADASPVYRIKKTVSQSDGTFLNVTRTGGNHLVYYITDDGIPVFPANNGDYCYAQFANDGEVVASDVIAHELSARSPMECRYADDYLSRFNSFLKMRNLARYSVGSREDASVSSIGDVRVPVILAEFKDVSFQQGNGIERFSKHFNASSYKEEGGAGSVRDYFISQSDSAFRPTFDVLAKVKVSRERSYYGANSGGNDIRARAYMSEAVDSAIAAGVDFSPYKKNNNEIFVVVIFPGPGEQVSSDRPELIWAAYYYSMSHTVGGLKFSSGLVMDELADYGEGEMFDGIGTFCHEFSHALGLPDFYNTNGASGIFGMDVWDIMDYGQFCNHTSAAGVSRTPVGYSAYEREFMGWLKVDTLENRKQTVTLAPLTAKSGHRAYRIPNHNDPTGDEYYLLENRQADDWYLSLYGEGMLVMHVDYSPSAWGNNIVNNNASHQRMTIIPADNALTPLANRTRYYKGDPFPGYTNNTELSSITTPCDTVYKGKYMRVRLSNIHLDSSRNIVFDYQHPYIVDSLSVTSMEAEGFTVSWAKMKFIQRYAVVLSQDGRLLRADTITTTSLNYADLDMNLAYTVSVLPVTDKYINAEPATLLVASLIGDVNRDGFVNSSDVVSIFNFIAQGEAADIKESDADVNRDGVVNSSDASAVYNIITGNN